MIVLDTNVVSEPFRPTPAASLVAWLDAQVAETLFLPAVCLAELLAGVETLPAGKRRVALKQALPNKCSLSSRAVSCRSTRRRPKRLRRLTPAL